MSPETNAQSKIDLGEFQMDLAETQLEAGEKQIEAGQEQIDDGFKQLKDALEQLKEGEEQLEDGAKQLEEAREDAYASADMNDILTVDTVKSLLAAQIAEKCPQALYFADYRGRGNIAFGQRGRPGPGPEGRRGPAAGPGTHRPGNVPGL